MKNFGKSITMGVVRAPIYRAHRTVIFAIAQLSCEQFVSATNYNFIWTADYSADYAVTLLCDNFGQIVLAQSLRRLQQF